jgi:hypothetical protein
VPFMLGKLSPTSNPPRLRSPMAINSSWTQLRNAVNRICVSAYKLQKQQYHMNGMKLWYCALWLDPLYGLTRPKEELLRAVRVHCR